MFIHYSRIAPQCVKAKGLCCRKNSFEAIALVVTRTLFLAWLCYISLQLFWIAFNRRAMYTEAAHTHITCVLTCMHTDLLPEASNDTQVAVFHVSICRFCLISHWVGQQWTMCGECAVCT